MAGNARAAATVDAAGAMMRARTERGDRVDEIARLDGDAVVTMVEDGLRVIASDGELLAAIPVTRIACAGEPSLSSDVLNGSLPIPRRCRGRLPYVLRRHAAILSTNVMRPSMHGQKGPLR